MQIDIDSDGRHIVLRAPATATPTVRQIPGRSWDPKRRVWVFPLSWATCVTARGIIGRDLEVTKELNEWAAQDRIMRREPALALREAKDLEPGSELDVLLNRVEATASCRLRPYQRPGAAFLAVSGSALFGWDMGTGKTPMAIRALQLLAAQGREVFPTLVVTPNSAKAQWAKRFGEWWPEARVVVAPSGTTAARKAVETVRAGDSDVLVLNWEALANLSRLAPYGSVPLFGCTECDPLSTRKPARCQREPKVLNHVSWRTVIADEAHRATEPKTQQTRALWAVGDVATYRFALTGSPPETPDKLWTIMRFVAPDEFPTKIAFLERYAVMTSNIWSGFPEATALKPETRAEFDRIFLPRFMRRPYAIVDDTEPIRERRDVELTGKQAKAYHDFREGLLAEVESGLIYTTDPLTKLLRLRQLASAYGEATDNGGMRLSEPSSKLDVLDEVLDELGSRQVVIFAESRQLIDLVAARMEKRGQRFGRITGAESPEDRATAVDRFETGAVQYVLCTVAAGGEAVDGLQVTDTAVFLQRPWSAQLNVQAEGRIRRAGQRGTPLFIDLVTTGTVEEAVLAALEDKAHKLEDLVRDTETLRAWLTGK